ncbi:LpqC [hydrothermal vent metagenome]|uniref:LpqC n=1 Tax=hydrothermal vent metagenome TaxID=652676 RepID=A0A3B0WH11_9ZZZZ
MPMMFKLALYWIFIILFTFATQATAQTESNGIDTSQSGWFEISLPHDKLTRYFRVYRPEKLDAHPAVVFVLHGGKQSMRQIFKKDAGGSQEWQTLADKEGFLLVVPNGINVKNGDTNGEKQNWNDCRVPIEGSGSSSIADDVGFIDSLITWTNEHYHTNLNRVYVTGASNGGMMTYRLVTELGDKFAAAVAFVANQPVLSDCAEPKYAIPLMIMNGTNDPLVLWKGGQIRKQGVALLSAEDTLQYWIKVNKLITRQRITNLPDNSTKDGSYIIQRIFPPDVEGSAELRFYQVKSGGHTMPSIKHDVSMLAKWLVGKQNKDLEATHEAWNFMKQFPTKEKRSAEE